MKEYFSVHSTSRPKDLWLTGYSCNTRKLFEFSFLDIDAIKKIEKNIFCVLIVN